MTRIAIVGGGRGALAFMNTLTSDAYTKIEGISDPNPAAPALVVARELGIPVARELDEILRRTPVDVVLELTGREDVRRKTWDITEGKFDFMSSGAARMMFDLMKRQEAEKNESVADDLGQVVAKMRESVRTTDETVRDIRGVLREMHILALNSAVEAARSGDAGAGFRVMAGRMHDLVGQLEKAMGKVEDSSTTSHHLLTVTEKAERALRREETVLESAEAAAAGS